MQQNPIPSFDTWTSIFLLVSSLGFFLSLILGSNKASRSHNLPIIFIILGFSFILVQYVLFWTRYESLCQYCYFFDSTWYLAFGPLLYTYITRFYHKSFTIRWHHFFLVIISFFINAYYLIKSDGFEFLNDFKGEVLLYIYWSLKSPWVAIISQVTYLVVIKDFISLSKNEVNSQYEAIREKWTSILTNLFLIFIISFTSYYILSKFSFFNLSWDYAISFSMSFSIYAIGYMVYKEPSIFNGELLSNLFLKESNGQELTNDTKDEFYTQLLFYINNNKPYLDNNLRLVHLADKTGFSTHILSKLINERAQKNFNQFINEYRLEEAKKLLLEDPSTSIKTIYFDVGFNNKATFNNAFKSKFKCTPSEYKKRHLELQDK